MHCKDSTTHRPDVTSLGDFTIAEDYCGYWGAREDLVEETIAGLKARFALDELCRIAAMLALEVAEMTKIPRQHVQTSCHECWIRSMDNPVAYKSVRTRKGGTRCLYDMDSDLGDDACIFCGQPEERK